MLELIKKYSEKTLFKMIKISDKKITKLQIENLIDNLKKDLNS